MKIITWNCNMAFRKKAHLLLDSKPDIVIVPECEHFERFAFDDAGLQPTDQLWFGKNKNKGIGIFSYTGYKLQLLEKHNKRLKLIIPIVATRGRSKLTLLAIWANNPSDPDGQYVTQVWKAIRYYKDILSNRNTMLIGDFNSNTIWDRPRRKGNHSTIVTHLEAKGIHSVYHRHFNQIQGAEQHPTLYLYRHKDKSYHIDYCFASEDLLQRLESVEVGDFESWNKYSDHVPVTVTFRNK